MAQGTARQLIFSRFGAENGEPMERSAKYCIFILYFTSAAYILPSILCSDPVELVFPQCIWNWAA